MTSADHHPPTSPHALSSRPALSPREMFARASGPLSPLGMAARALGWIERRGRLLIIGVPYVWLAVFFLVPFLIVLKLSFGEPQLAQPPYTPLFAFVTDGGGEYLTIRLNLSNFIMLVQDDLFLHAYLNRVQNPNPCSKLARCNLVLRQFQRRYTIQHRFGIGHGQQCTHTTAKGRHQSRFRRLLFPLSRCSQVHLRVDGRRHHHKSLQSAELVFGWMDFDNMAI